MEKILEKLFCIIEPYLKPKKVSFDIQPFTENDTVKAKYGVMFKNIGATDATINGFPLLAGDPSITFPVDKNEEDTTAYKIQFTGGSGEIWMIRKTRTK